MASTDYRIADIEGNELFNFNNASTGVGAGYFPDLENMSLSLQMDSVDYRAAGLNSAFYVGFSPRSFVIRGALIHDTTNYNMWRLSSIQADKKIVKIYLGSYWFVYGLFMENTFSRIEGRPNVWQYQCTFNCFDPWIYYAGTGDTPSGDYNIKPGTEAMDGSSRIEIDLDLTGEARSFGYIEPIFILEGGASTSVSSSQYVRFTDQDGRRLEFTPPDNWTNNVDYVIAPNYFREDPEGYVPQLACGYRVQNGAITPSSDWFLDQNCYDNGVFVHASSKITKDFASLETYDASASNLSTQHHYDYPRAIAGQEDGASGNRITVASNGTLTDATITAQYLFRRL